MAENEKMLFCWPLAYTPEKGLGLEMQSLFVLVLKLGFGLERILKSWSWSWKKSLDN